MKRAELEVGAHLMYRRSTTYSYGQGEAIVLDTRPWVASRAYSRRDMELREVTLSDGRTAKLPKSIRLAEKRFADGVAGVLVQIESKPKVVPLSHLRGDYEEARTAELAEQEARNAEYAKRREEQAQREAERQAANALIAEYGLRAWASTSHSEALVSVTVPVFTRIIGALREAGIDADQLNGGPE